MFTLRSLCNGTRRRLFCVASLGVLVLSAPLASAAPADAAAITRFEEGRKAFEAGQFETALASFQASLSLLPSPNTRLYIARCYRALGKPASAFTSYRRAAAEATDRIRDTGEKRFGITRDGATSEMGEIEPTVPRLTLAVPSDAPAEMIVKVDDVEVPRAAWGTAVETDPGKHYVTASAPRRRKFEKELQLASGQQLRIELLTPRVPTARIALRFTSRPSGLDVQVDGAPLDPADWASVREVDPGEHRIIARAPGYGEFISEKRVTDGTSLEVTVSLFPAKAPPVRLPKWMFFTATGLAVASIGIAAGVAVSAKSTAGAQESLSPLARDPSAQSDIQGLSTDANILFVSGAVFAAGAGVLFFFTDWTGRRSSDSPPADRAALAPWVTPEGAGLVAKGAF